jgi:hypothetical protein
VLFPLFFPAKKVDNGKRFICWVAAFYSVLQQVQQRHSRLFRRGDAARLFAVFRTATNGVFTAFRAKKAGQVRKQR